MPRYFQFSLRTLLILMAVVSLGLGWWTYKAQVQRHAVVSLRRSGAEILYNRRSAEAIEGLEAYWIDFCCAVTTVELTQPLADSDLESLKALQSAEIGVSWYGQQTHTDAEKLRQALTDGPARVIEAEEEERDGTG